MKYKKFKPIAITPLWAKIIIWIFTVYISAFVISILWLLASNIADEISYPYKNTTFDHVKLLFVPKNIFYADDLLFFIIIFIILLFILFPLIFVPIAYTAKFYSRKFKLSDIRNPEKYDPDVIRQYFPEYLSKKEREERAANTDEKAKEDLQKATEIINKYTKELGEDKVISIIKGVWC